jgi:hypothetical protein
MEGRGMVRFEAPGDKRGSGRHGRRVQLRRPYPRWPSAGSPGSRSGTARRACPRRRGRRTLRRCCPSRSPETARRCCCC